LPTIKDIARVAGVSHGTVSNVLNKTGKVSAQKIRLVEEAAKKLSYIPNAQAQLLRQGAANHIAVIIPTLCDARYRDLFLAVQSGLSIYDFEISVHCTDDIPNNEEKILAQLPLSKLAAIISVSSLQEKMIVAYKKLTCPVIAVDRIIDIDSEKDKFINFCFDYHLAGSDIGKYVLQQNWKRVAFFCAAGNQSDDANILAGINDVLKNDSVSIETYSADTKFIINKAFDIVNEEQIFDGIVTIGSLRADAVMAAAEFLPKNKRTQLVSIGESQIFPNLYIKTYEMDYGQMGAAIAGSLHSYLHEKRPFDNRIVLRPKGFSFTFPNINIRKSKDRKLHMLTLVSPSTTALEKLLPSLYELTGITLKITYLPHNDLYSHLRFLNNKFSYDLVRMDTAWLDSLGRRIYMPMEEAGIARDMITNDLPSHMQGNYYYADGVMCALPFDPSVQIFLYRSDLFHNATLCRLYYEKYRKSLAVPRTIDDYLQVAEFFTKSCNSDSPTQYGTTITGGNAYITACDFLPYYLARGAAVCEEDGSVKLDTPDMHAAMMQYKKMKQYTRSEENPWWLDSVRQFADGNTATAPTFSNHAAYIINSKHSNVAGKTGVAVIPGNHPLLGGGVLGICKYSGKIDACKQFFDWFYTRDIASSLVRLGGTSPLAEAYNNYENFSVFPWLSTEKESFIIGTRGSGQICVPGFSNRHYEYALGTAVRNMLNQTMSPDEAASFAQIIYDSKGTEGWT